MGEMREVLYRIWVDPKKHCLERPVRMALLADLHNNQIGRENEVLIKKIRKFNPDLVLVAGDLIVGEPKSDLSVAKNLMVKLSKDYAIYYANGNHEHRMRENPQLYGKLYEEYSRSLKENRIHLLENASERVRIHGMEITLYGLELEQMYFKRNGARKKLTLEEMRNKLGVREKETFSILLAHNPVFFPVYARWGANLVCAGHLHGGMIRIPGLGGLVSPQLCLFPKYDRGRYEERNSTMIVSAGLGSHTIPIRILNPIEMVWIELTNERAKVMQEETMVKWKRKKRG